MIGQKNYPGSEQCIRLYLLIIKWGLYIAQLAVIASLYQKSKKIDGFYARIATEKCSDDFTNGSFNGFNDILNLYGVKRALISLIVVAIIIFYNFLYESISHCKWLITCGCAEVCGNQREENRQAQLHNNSLNTIQNQGLRPVEAPGLSTRKEMAHVVAGNFMRLLGKTEQPAQNMIILQTTQNGTAIIPIMGQ